MTQGQMLLVLLGAMLFTTTVIGTYRRTYDVSNFTYQMVYRNQAMKVADLCFQRIDARIIGKKQSFNDVYDQYKNGAVETVTLYDTPGDVSSASSRYRMYIHTYYCTNTGTMSGSVTNYMRVHIAMQVNVGGLPTITVGDTTSTKMSLSTYPIAQIVAKTGI